jgi:hypothetical protein
MVRPDAEGMVRPDAEGMVRSDDVPQSGVQSSFAQDPSRGDQTAAAVAASQEPPGLQREELQGDVLGVAVAETVSGTSNAGAEENVVAVGSQAGAAGAGENASSQGLVSREIGLPVLHYSCDISRVVLLHFSPEDSSEALRLLSSASTDPARPSAAASNAACGSLGMSLLNLQAGLVGGMMLPGSGPNTGDMTVVQQLLVIAMQYRAQYMSPAGPASIQQQQLQAQVVSGGASNVRNGEQLLKQDAAVCVNLFSVGGSADGSLHPAAAVAVAAAAHPSSHAMTLSSDWRPVKPPGVPSPGPVEFVVDMQVCS